MTHGDERMACYLVTKQGKDDVRGSYERRPLRELPPGDVTVRVEWSSLNYKDALAARGHPGVVRRFPHVPGIDAAGTITQSNSPDLPPGMPVLVTSYELGAGQWGAWAEYIRVPAEWVLPLPNGWSPREAMIYGTAGLTAALCVDVLRRHDVEPSSGEVAVTGASGGVGSIAVSILAQLGYQVVAVSGKESRHDWLRELGASEILPREAVTDTSSKPLLTGRWAGAVDTVGGNTLATLLRASRHNACITACGLVGGHELPLTVYPFILRGATLAGIDSVHCPRERRLAMWQHLATDWRTPLIERDAIEASLGDIDQHVESILRGEVAGRVIVRPS